MNRIIVMASTGVDIETLIDVNDEDRQMYAEMVKKINAAPKGAMLEPSLEWPGNQWDDLIASTEEAWGKPKTWAEMQKEESS